MSAVSQTTSPETWPLSPEQRAASGLSEAFVAQLVADLPVDEAWLRATLAEAAIRHDALAPAYVAAPGYRGLRRVPLGAPAAQGWTVRDLRGQEDAEARIAEDLEALRSAPFDLARGETLRAALWRLDGGASRIAIAVSPLAADRTTLALLAAALAGEAATSSARPDEDGATYAQYADWRREMEADEDAPRGRAYWRGQSAADAAPPPLTYQEAHASGLRAERRVAIDPDQSTRFAVLVGDAGLEAGLLALWAAVLGRISGQDVVSLGWRHDCRRDYAMFAGVAGPFEKTLPLRVGFDAAASFGDHLGGLVGELAAHLDWQEHLPLDGVDAATASPLGFGLDVAPALSGGWSRRAFDGPSAFELELRPEIDAGDRLVALALSWDTGRYGEAATETLLEQVVTLLGAIIARPATPLGALAIVGPKETARLASLDRAHIKPPSRSPLLPTILGWAERTPAAPALAGGGVTLDYAELGERVGRIASALVARGVGPETVVALDLPRSVDLVVALLGVWRSGAAYLPLDPAWPAARRRQLREAAGAALVLHGGEVGDAHVGTPALSVADALAETAEVTLPPLEAPEDRAAYVLFTSGSTGAPKGVVVEHGQLANYVAAVRDAADLGGSRRFALASTVAADLGNTTLFAALANGAILAIASEDEAREADAFASFLRRNAVDCAKFAPSHLAALLDGGDPVIPATLILGGEPVPQALLGRIRAINPAARVVNHYGPTETTVGVLVHHCEVADAGPAARLTRALDGNAILVLDDAGRLAATGSVGQLHVGGAQLCRGYLGMEGAGFVDDPTTPGRRLYPTGDLARYRPEGGVEIVGRADGQIKINGHRVEPGEVEATLADLEGVRQAAVDVRRDVDGIASLVGFVTSADDIDVAALKAALAERLPAPMVPTRIVALQRMPLLANGKLDRAALAARELDDGRDGVAPRNALETVLRNLAAELLGRPGASVGVTDDFFDLGGNSLLVIKFVARVRKLFGLDVPPGIVFDHPSVAALAEALRAGAPDGRLDRVAELRLTLAALPEDEKAKPLAEPTPGATAS
ncbi:non-ribosomal peptide synthetase [Methylopila sp. Yamaguchi]|uniref:non-ribosomal peptide synthetase n=1 Tax=Methylopila sp. Yamaguchi TaxID=1437817 RepID=UPI000CADC87A|nr:amino acid adenylation domain-containing protein [Methylopila sp. Yamaguchi]GBD49889.1 amino acid adenylation domain-containing protein [Methylopila sp. Yamaguchi]